MSLTIEEIQNASLAIEPFTRRTPLTRTRWLSDLVGAEVWFKCENEQRTGSFKLRGAFHKMLVESHRNPAATFVTASTGNHGLAVAEAASKLGKQAEIFAPRTADPSKLSAISQTQIKLNIYGEDCVAAEAAAREHGQQSGAVYISPYNDIDVIAGQATVGWEIAEQWHELARPQVGTFDEPYEPDAIFVAVGGGGLAAGIGLATQHQFPNCRLIGCSPENSQVLLESLRQGKLLDLPSLETISDGTAGGVEAGAITFEICQRVVNESIAVSETEIRDALFGYLEHQGALIEGAAAVPIASLIRNRHQFKGQRIVVVLCGANISCQRLMRLLEEQPPISK